MVVEGPGRSESESVRSPWGDERGAEQRCVARDRVLHPVLVHPCHDGALRHGDGLRDKEVWVGRGTRAFRNRDDYVDGSEVGCRHYAVRGSHPYTGKLHRNGPSLVREPGPDRELWRVNPDGLSRAPGGVVD